MTIKEIIDGLKFTVDMFLFDPITGETFAEPRNDMDKTTIDACKGAIKLLEQTRWIPVSEKFPEEYLCDDGYVEPSDYVLVWGDYGNYGVSRYWGNRKSKSTSPNTYKDWMDLDWAVQKPIAWMPLPEPMKVGEENC